MREQLSGAGMVEAKRMFGEWGLYLDGKFIGVICDDTLFLKDTPGARAAFPEAETAPPYPGAKPALVASPLLDEPERLRSVARAVWDDLPEPRPKTPRKKP
ncbi:TfoX/Sxy family protein [Pararhodobacter marinus]|uniref:TfoX/Sxy family protein n=1 Tax=Pararhodobacter marinus TaxID=2184063 RepID=UPI00351172C6